MDHCIFTFNDVYFTFNMYIDYTSYVVIRLILFVLSCLHLYVQISLDCSIPNWKHSLVSLIFSGEPLIGRAFLSVICKPRTRWAIPLSLPVHGIDIWNTKTTLLDSDCFQKSITMILFQAFMWTVMSIRTQVSCLQ